MFNIAYYIGVRQILGVNINKKRPSSSGMTPEGFLDDEPDCDPEGDQDRNQDPRKEDWKIQKKKGFAKDQDEKARMLKRDKASKTSKKNSKAPILSFITNY